MLHNLLPPIEKKEIRIEYLVRLSTVVVLLLTGAVCAGLIALLPTYLKVQSDIATLEFDVGDSRSSATSSTGVGGADQQLLSNVQKTLAVFDDTLRQGQVTEIIDTALSVRPDSVAVEGVAYNHESHVVTLEGVASSRDALVAYARALEDTPLFGRVPLSLSDLAKNADIRFQLAFSVEKTP